VKGIDHSDSFDNLWNSNMTWSNCYLKSKSKVVFFSCLTVDTVGLESWNSVKSILLQQYFMVLCLGFLPARRYASAGYSDRIVSVRPSVCPSVCPSVTCRYCVKTKKASGMISAPSGSPKTLVFWRQILSPNSKGFPPNGGLKQGSVGKIQRFFSFKRLYLENSSRYGQSYY